MQPSHPLSSPSPPAFNLSSIRVFFNESTLHIRWPKYWGFSFSISPFNEYSGLISFRLNWLDLLAVQGSLKSLLQHHSSKASILRCSAFFIVQLSHPYMTTGKTIALSRSLAQTTRNHIIFCLIMKVILPPTREKTSASSHLLWESDVLVTSVTSPQLQIGTLLSHRSLLKAINSLHCGSLLLWIAMLRRDLFSLSLSATPLHSPGSTHWSGFTGAAVKRYHISKVRETQVRG